MKSLAKDGVTKSSPLSDRPLLFEDLQDVYQSFLWLVGTRTYNQAGPQPLPFSEYVSFLDERQIFDREERREYITYFRALDNKLLDLTHQKMARERERLSNKKGPSKTR